MKLNNVDVSDLMSSFPSRLELWKRFLELSQSRTMAEIGVWKGDFAAEILKGSPAIDLYYLIDPWANLPDWNKPWNVTSQAFVEIYAEMDSKTSFAGDRRRILRGRTKEVVSQIPDASLDFAYIDGDHTLRGITIDLISIWPKIKQGGFIGGDDFVNTPWQHDVKFEPTMVCPLSVYFAEAMNVPIVAFEHGQFLLVKDDKAEFSFRDTTGAFQDLSLNKMPPSAGV